MISYAEEEAQPSSRAHAMSDSCLLSTNIVLNVMTGSGTRSGNSSDIAIHENMLVTQGKCKHLHA